MSFLLGATSTESAEDNNLGKGEFECFKKEPQLHHDDNALLWWKTNQERFTIIGKVAYQLLCVPTTSVPSERIFSAAYIATTCSVICNFAYTEFCKCSYITMYIRIHT